MAARKRIAKSRRATPKQNRGGNEEVDAQGLRHDREADPLDERGHSLNKKFDAQGHELPDDREENVHGEDGAYPA